MPDDDQDQDYMVQLGEARACSRVACYADSCEHLVNVITQKIPNQPNRLVNHVGVCLRGGCLLAHRFGADAVFRCKDTVMSDQDLDAVLERGAKKTKEMQSKLNVAEKGDMLDFSFDDGTGVQVR